MPDRELGQADPTLGGFLNTLEQKLKGGWSNDSCVLCGSTTKLLHPVERAWACSDCHTPTPECEYPSCGCDVENYPCPRSGRPKGDWHG